MPAHTRALIRIVLRGRAMPLHSYTLCFIFSSSIFINNPCALNDDVWSVDTWSGTHVSAERWIFIFISFVGYNVMRIQLHDEKYKNITESEIDKCRIDIDNWSERTDCFYKIPSMLSSAMRFYFIVSKNDTETRANWIASNIWNQMTPAARYWIIKVHCSLTIELNFFCMRRRPRLHRRRVPNFISEALPINSYQSIFHVREVPNPHGDINSSIIMNNCSHMPFDPYYDFYRSHFELHRIDEVIHPLTNYYHPVSRCRPIHSIVRLLFISTESTASVTDSCFLWKSIRQSERMRIPFFKSSMNVEIECKFDCGNSIAYIGLLVFIEYWFGPNSEKDENSDGDSHKACAMCICSRFDVCFVLCAIPWFNAQRKKWIRNRVQLWDVGRPYNSEGSHYFRISIVIHFSPAMSLFDCSISPIVQTSKKAVIEITTGLSIKTCKSKCVIPNGPKNIGRVLWHVTFRFSSDLRPRYDIGNNSFISMCSVQPRRTHQVKNMLSVFTVHSVFVFVSIFRPMFQQTHLVIRCDSGCIFCPCFASRSDTSPIHVHWMTQKITEKNI